LVPGGQYPTRKEKKKKDKISDRGRPAHSPGQSGIVLDNPGSQINGRTKNKNSFNSELVIDRSRVKELPQSLSAL